MSLLSPQLEAFLAIAKHKTVHAAAAAIYLTQTAVTQRLRGLEKSLKTTLFIRTRRGMILTKEGEALLRYCHATKELEGEALAKIQGAGLNSEIELTICAPTSIMHSRIIPATVPIMKKFPHLLLHFNVSDLDNRHQLLRAAQADFAIIPEEHLADEMVYKRLIPEKYVLVCSPEWKGRKLKEIIKQERIIDFDESDQVTFNYLKQYDLFDEVRHSRYFVNRTDNLANLVAAGVGYTTLAKEFARPYIEQKMLITLNKSLTYDLQPVLVWYARHESPAYFSAIIDSIT